ncbi:hypothetical protein WME89_13500 [Sorangium sp. So ce321]
MSSAASSVVRRSARRCERRRALLSLLRGRGLEVRPAAPPRRRAAAP